MSNEVRHLTCRVPEHAVGPICERGWRATFRKLRNRFSKKRLSKTRSNSNYPYVERIWFPYYLYTIEVSSRKGPGTMLFTVEAWSGAFAIFQLDEFFATGPLDTGERFEPKLDEAACEQTGRETLLHTIMRQRSRSGGKPIPGKVIDRELLYYPLWVYYFERKPGVVDIKILDAVSGQLVGHRTRSGVLEAFLDREESKQRDDQSSSLPSSESQEN